MKILAGLGLFALGGIGLIAAGQSTEHAASDTTKAVIVSKTHYPAHTVPSGLRWTEKWEMCLRQSDGRVTCWYALMAPYATHNDTYDAHNIGDHLDHGILDDFTCAPHPTPSNEAADKACPAWNPNGDPVTTTSNLEGVGQR